MIWFLISIRFRMFFPRFLLIFFPIMLFAEIKIPVSFSATFVQKVTTPRQKTTLYSGELLVNRSREFRWVYRRPTVREICGDGSQVRVIDRQLEQVVVYTVGSLLDLMQLLKRAKPYRGDIYLAKYHGVRYTLKLDRQKRLEQVAYKDEMENVVNIRFHGVRYHARPFPAEQLRCTVPESYDVIRG